MKLYRIIILFVLFINFACKNKKEVNIYSNKTINTDTSNVIKTCNCFDGIGSKMGDTPTMILTFSNGQSISVCGYLDKEMQGNIISEFNVFDCNSGKVISEYDAMQICRIIPKKDTLIIQALKYLPTGKNWKWNLIQLGEEIITIKDKKIISTGIKPKLEKFSINENEANFYLNSLTKGKGHNKEWELEIGKLEVLTLLGYKKAKIILENYEEYTGQETDGAVAETWKDAVSTTQWINKNCN